MSDRNLRSIDDVVVTRLRAITIGGPSWLVTTWTRYPWRVGSPAEVLNARVRSPIGGVVHR